MILACALSLVALMTTTARANGSPTLLVVGDSLSAGYGLELGEGWVDLLATRLTDTGYEYRIVNASISGDTTAGGLARLVPALKKHTPAIVVIGLGGNDGLRGIPLKTVRKNFEQIVECSRDAGAEVVLLGMRIPGNYGRRYADEFHGLYGELADAYNLPWVDFFMDGVALDMGLMQPDGIHPNAAGQSRLLDNAWPAIVAALEKSNVDNTPKRARAAAGAVD